jgi:hypothetical protein
MKLREIPGWVLILIGVVLFIVGTVLRMLA